MVTCFDHRPNAMSETRVPFLYERLRSKKKERNDVDGFQRANRDGRGTMGKRDSGSRNSSGSLAMTEERWTVAIRIVGFRPRVTC